MFKSFSTPTCLIFSIVFLAGPVEDDDDDDDDDEAADGFNDPLGLPAFPRGSCVFSGLSFNSNKSDFEFLVFFFLKLGHQ